MRLIGIVLCSLMVLNASEAGEPCPCPPLAVTVRGVGNRATSTVNIPVSYTHLTLPTNREV